MIMQWKRQGNDWTASWQGIHFTLFEHPTTKRWELLSDGKHVRETWTTSHRAMETIDARQQALIIQAARVRPRLLTALEPTPHADGARNA